LTDSLKEKRIKQDIPELFNEDGKMKKDIVVLGAGISGLTTAFWLKKEGFNITILESGFTAGGAMITEKENEFLVDYGPNSGLETTPLISQIVKAVGMEDQMVYANEQAEKRYILKEGQLHPLPTSPAAFIKSKLFSMKAKLRLLKEPFVGKSEDGYYQSIAEFVSRRLGQEFLDYAIDPFVSGVFAGNPSRLSVKSAFPKLYRLEEVYGGLIKGMIRGAKERKKRAEQSKQDAKMFSFINGMQTFPKAIASRFGSDIQYNVDVKKIKRNGERYEIQTIAEGKETIFNSDLVLSTIPSYRLADSLDGFGIDIVNHLHKVEYPKVMVLFLGFKKNDIGQPLDGFGFLIPTKEKRNFLGSIWSSTIFENRAGADSASFTIFVGGAKEPNPLENLSDELINDIIGQFKELMKINGDPIYIRKKVWEKAIPQYNIGYVEHENYFNQFEKENPGLFLSGNYRGGISVGDCVKNSKAVADKIISLCDSYK